MSDPPRFHWDIAGLSKQRFVAFTNLLVLREGGRDGIQLDVPTPNDPVETRDKEQSSTRMFLNRLAEVIARDEANRQVACAVMSEHDGHAKVYVARNEPFRAEDKGFFRSCEILVKNISSDPHDSDAVKKELWDAMVEYHAPRLDHYLEDVHQQLGTLQETIAALKDRELTEEESKTADLVKQFNILHLSRSSMRPREYASRMTRRAYVIRRNVMDRKIKPPEGLAKLFLAVDRLSKLRASYRTIVEVAAMLQSFDIVEITAKALPMETPTPMDFDAVLAHLGVPSGLRSSSRYLPDAMTKSEAKRRFKHLQEKELQSHPEVHLLIALLENQVNMTNFLPYMGVSKKSCYLCWSFLKAHGKFIPRGSHGKLYSKWMIPTTGMIDAREAENMCNAVKAVETDLRRRLKEKMGLKMDAAESTIGAFSPREDTRSIASALSPIAPKSHLSVGGAFTPRPSTPLGLFLAPLSPVARTITIHSEYNDSNRSEVGSKDSAISTISSDEGATTTARSVKLPSERPARAVTPNHIAASQHSGMRTPKPLSLKSGRSGSRTPKPPTVASLKSGKSALHSVRLISPMKAIRPLGSRKSIKSVPTTVGSVSTVTDEFMTRAWDCRYHDKKLCELLKAASGEVMHPVVRKALMKDTTKRIESLKKKYGVE